MPYTAICSSMDRMLEKLRASFCVSSTPKQMLLPLRKPNACYVHKGSSRAFKAQSLLPLVSSQRMAKSLFAV